VPSTALSQHPVEDASQVAVARGAAVEAASRAGLSGPVRDTAALVATELAQNLHRHAVGGQLWLMAEPGRVTLIAVDVGPGVPGFVRCLVDGYTTAGTMGTGLGAVRRAALEFDAVSEPGRGTVVVVTLGARPAAAVADVAALGTAAPREEVSGDAWAWRVDGADLLLLVADGLGHGPDAATASLAAAHVVRESREGAPDLLLRQVDEALLGTRGAAVSLARTSVEALTSGGHVVTAGLGNVSLVLAGPDGRTRRAATGHGTAGTGLPSRFVPTPMTIEAGGAVLLHTDGLTSRWDLQERTELLRHRSVTIAAALLRDHRRGSDDSLVLVAKALG
jgi:anti-sigma regulatory factor (Ser/Thr protein kinase)